MENVNQDAVEEKTVEVNGVQMTEQQKRDVQVKPGEKLKEVSPGVFKTLQKMNG